MSKSGCMIDIMYISMKKSHMYFTAVIESSVMNCIICIITMVRYCYFSLQYTNNFEST